MPFFLVIVIVNYPTLVYTSDAGFSAQKSPENVWRVCENFS